jgi:hypothetical protein
VLFVIGAFDRRLLGTTAVAAKRCQPDLPCQVTQSFRQFLRTHALEDAPVFLTNGDQHPAPRPGDLVRQIVARQFLRTSGVPLMGGSSSWRHNFLFAIHLQVGRLRCRKKSIFILDIYSMSNKIIVTQLGG